MGETEYKLAHEGPEIDEAVERALHGGEIDAALESKAEIEFLDNTDFTNPVAQAGIGGMHGSVAYALDRWKLISGAVSWTSNGLTLNGTIRQIREFSIGFPVVPSIEMHSGTATITYDDSTKYCDITSAGGVIKRPHLGLIAITDWSKIPPADYGEQLAICKRFYQRFGGKSAYQAFGSGYFSSTTNANIVLPSPVEMRIVPTLTYGGSLVCSGIAVSALAINNTAGQNCTGLVATVIGATAGQGTMLYANNDLYSAYIAFSADL